jgi:hypothetical protein
MNQLPPGPKVFHCGHFEFFRKFAEIFANECLSPVSTTPAINPFHGFLVIAGVVDTGEIITGVNDTGDQLSLVTTTPAINLLPVTRTRTPWRWEVAKDVEGKKSAISPAAEVGHGR